MGLCFACHQADGKGLPNAFPPLAASDYMLADRDRAIRTVLNGLTGAVTVNGKKYESMMPPQEAVLTDAQIADVLTYSFNTWGNTGDAFSTAQVKALRNETH
jgi:nitrite reductase (NO-forming)